MSAPAAARYTVRHVTEVRYSGVVKLARFNLRLTPAPWPGQTLLHSTVQVDPAPKSIVTQPGPFIVNLARLTLAQPTASLRVTSEFAVMVDRPAIGPDCAAPSVAQVRGAAQQARSLAPDDPSGYLFPSPLAALVPAIGEWARPLLADDTGIVAAAAAVMEAIHAGFAYDGTATGVNTLPLEAFRQRRGVCQDFAHIMIIALRHCGIPAAYVSGYLRTNPPPGRPRLIGADATHAWVNVWCGAQLGWIGFDPTNAVVVGNDHIFTAMGRDFADVSPVDGVFIGGRGQRMKVAVDVVPA